MWPLVFLLLHTLPVCWFVKTVKLGGFSGEVCQRKFARGVGLKVVLREGPFVSMRRSLRRQVGKISFPFVSLFRKIIEISPQISPRATATNRENSTQGDDFPAQYLYSKRQDKIWAAKFRNQHFESFWCNAIQKGLLSLSFLGHAFLWLQGLWFLIYAPLARQKWSHTTHKVFCGRVAYGLPKQISMILRITLKVSRYLHSRLHVLGTFSGNQY